MARSRERASRPGRRAGWRRLVLPEGEVVGPHTGLEELDPEGAIRNRSRLPNELIKTRILHPARPLRVHVVTMTAGWRSAVQCHAKPNRLPRCGWRQHEVKIACVKPVGDRARHLIERREFAADRPEPRKVPLVARQCRGGLIETGLVCADAAGRREILAVRIADIRL